jgi:antitoxin component YwqK of YwqJK toxin-antitoxin module
MKNFLGRFLVYISLFLFSCEQEGESTKVEEVININMVHYTDHKLENVIINRRNGLWLSKTDSTLISGFVFGIHPNDSMALKFGVVNGKKEGVSLSYFTSGKLNSKENYKNNKLSGVVKRWSEKYNYQLTAMLNYKKGKLNGEQKKWYNTGELFKIRNINMGQEDGMQKAFRKNGQLYVNYEARNGNHYGMKRSMLCVEVEDEKVISNE